MYWETDGRLAVDEDTIPAPSIMKASPPRQRLLPLATWALLTALVAQACAGGSPSGAPATAPPSVEPRLTPSPTSDAVAPTLEPLAAVTLGDHVIFYGEEVGDAAMGLAAGDFNGDGILDVALAAAHADGPRNARPDGGEAYAFFGPFTPGETRDTALGGQDVTIFGAAEGDQLGRAVASADVNGDGLDDLVLGAPFADGPDGERPDSGETYVLLGVRSWPASIDLAAEPAAAVVYGADEKDLAGFSLAVAEVNGDDVDDLLVGALWADGPDNARPDAGEAYLILGSPSWHPTIDLADGEQDVKILGAETGDRLAETLAVGDVNGDGVDDLVIAATFASGPENQRPKTGEVYVILGGELETAYDLSLRQPEMTVLGRDEGDQIGHSAAVGDFDGDGTDDMLLGAVSADGPDNGRDLAGEAYLVLSGASLPATIDTLEGGEALRVYGADAVDRLGRSTAAGDLNGDGRNDLLVAASGGDGSEEFMQDAGEIYGIYGRPELRGALDLAHQAADVVVQGLDAGDVLGTNTFGRPSLLSEDMDGDGLSDVLVSAAGDGPANDRTDAGEAYILFARR